MTHDHDNPNEFEAACPVCELDEVSLQDTGRPWRARLSEIAAPRPVPGQREAGAA